MTEKKPRLTPDHPTVVLLDETAQRFIREIMEAVPGRVVTLMISDVDDPCTVFRTNLLGAPATLAPYLAKVCRNVGHPITSADLDAPDGEPSYIIKPVHPA